MLLACLFVCLLVCFIKKLLPDTPGWHNNCVANDRHTQHCCHYGPTLAVSNLEPGQKLVANGTIKLSGETEKSLLQSEDCVN